MPDIKKIKLGDTTYNICDANAVHTVDGIAGATVNRFGTCGTAAATAAKTVSVTTGTFSLEAGARVSVKFTYTNTASTPTLNVAGKGAKNIFHKGAQITSGSNKALLAGVCDFIYDGTQWHLVGNYIDTNTTYSVATTSANGLMSKEDKSHHDKMWNVWSADGTDETLVNKVEEVLTVFENFPEADNLVEVLSGKSNVGHAHEVTTADAAPAGHTHTVTVSGTTGNNSGSVVKAVTGYTSFSGGSGKLEAYDAATGGNKKVSNGTRIPVVTSVTHSPASLTGDKTFVKKQGTFSAGTTPVSSASFEGTAVTSGPNSGSAVTALTGVRASSTDVFVRGINAGSGSLEFYADSTTTTAESKTDGRIPFVTSISSTKASASGTAKAGSETHTHAYDKTTGISLTANTSTATGRIKYVESISGGSGSLTTDTTATNGIKYVESISSTGASASGTDKAGSETHTHTYSKANLNGSNSSHTVKYMKFSAGTTPKSGATPNHTSTNSGANSGTAVTALTGVKVTTQPTIGLTANTATATGRIQYVESISGGSGSLKSYDAATDGTAKTSSGRIQYVHDVSHTAASLTGPTTFVTAQGTFSAGTTPVSSASFTGSAVTSGPNSGDAITAVTSVGANGTATALTGVKVSSVSPAAPAGHTHTVTVSGTTGNNSGTGVTAVNASVSGTLLTLTAVTAAPHTHTHSYGSSTALTTTANNGTNFNAVTAVAANGTATVLTGVKASSTASVAPSGHTHSVTAAGSIGLTRGTAPSLGKATTGTVGISGGSISKTIYYLEHGHAGASATTKYLSASASGTAVGANGTASVAPSGHAHAYDKTTSITLIEGQAPSMNFNTKTTTDTPYVASATNSSLSLSYTATPSDGPSATTSFVTGVTGGTTSATTKYLHHSHSAASATTKYLSAAPSNTSTASAGPSATTSFVTGVSGGTTTATTRYLEHIHIASSVSSSATAVTAVAASSSASVAPSSHTHTVTAEGSIDLTRGTAPSLGTATTGTVGISGGSITPTTYYLEHGHTAASLGTASTANAAPHTHTHSYGSSTALTTTANSGTTVDVVTEVKASTN